MKVSDYNPAAEWLASPDRKWPLNEQEQEELRDRFRKMDEYAANEGYEVRRIERSLSERAFHDQWLVANRPDPWVSEGLGVLQCLFMKSTGNIMNPREPVLLINERDRYIAASVIQWLGTNVGLDFLSAALARFDMQLTHKRS